MMQAVFWQVGQLFMSWPVLYELRLQKQQTQMFTHPRKKSLNRDVYHNPNCMSCFIAVLLDIWNVDICFVITVFL